jgi:hypothetical protein
MLIYANGDSFTAGASLSDHIIPGYPGEFTREELVTRKKEIDKFDRTKGIHAEKYVEYNKVLAGDYNLTFSDGPSTGWVKFDGVQGMLDKSYTYISELEKLDNSIKTINGAVAGASMAGICHRTVLDLLDLKSKNVKVDQVVIQLTSTGRYEVFTLNHKHFLFDRPVGYFNNPSTQAISNAMVVAYDNDTLLIKYMYHLTTLKEIVQSITGKFPIIIDSCNGQHIGDSLKYTRHRVINNPYDDLDYFEKLVEHSMITQAHFNFMEEASHLVSRPFVYDTHFSKETHRITAKKLLELL